MDDRIELRIGRRPRRSRQLPAEPHLDLAFIDADKTGYPTYWAELVPRMRPGGLIAVDNVLWAGRVLDPGDDEGTATIVEFNDMVLADDRVDSVMLPIADGLTLARRRELTYQRTPPSQRQATERPLSADAAGELPGRPDHGQHRRAPP